MKRASPENDHPQKATDDSDAEAHPLPVLSSACPGFVCYAEKTHGPTLLKHISAVKSPQAVMGTIVKSHVAEALGVAPDALFHASVMPCFDKKLEASRADFSRDVAVPEGGRTTATQETDCVLTTGEVAQLIADAEEAGAGRRRAFRFARRRRRRRRARAPARRRWRARRAPRAGRAGWRARGTSRGTSPGTSPGTAMDTDCGDALTTEEERRISVRPLGSGRRRRERLGTWTTRSGARRWFCLGLRWRALFRSRPRAPKNPDLREVTLEVGGKTVLRFAAHAMVPEHPERRAQVQSRRARRRRRGRVRFRGDHGVPFGVPERRRQLRPPPAFEPGFRLSERALTRHAGGHDREGARG